MQNDIFKASFSSLKVYKQHNADCNGLQWISATIKSDVPGRLKGRKKPLLLIASGNLKLGRRARQWAGPSRNFFFVFFTFFTFFKKNFEKKIENLIFFKIQFLIIFSKIMKKFQSREISVLHQFWNVLVRSIKNPDAILSGCLRSVFSNLRRQNE